MGVFDSVQFEHRCSCGWMVTEFQSKSPLDGEPAMRHLSSDQVVNWYATCDHCGLWHEFTNEFEVMGITHTVQDDREW